MAEVDNIINQPSESESRINQLSGKVREEAEAREAAEKVAKEAEAKAQEAQRTAEFAEGFLDVVSKNPDAKDFKDDIKAKVLSGYTLEDATYAVLGAAGKLGNPSIERPSPAGGSADTNPSPQTVKSASEMTREELRTALLEAQARGDLSMS